MKIRRNCVACGKKLIININKDRTYDNGYYFGKRKIPVGKGKNVKVGTTKLLGRTINVVKWSGKEKEVEHWECNKCANED